MKGGDWYGRVEVEVGSKGWPPGRRSAFRCWFMESSTAAREYLRKSFLGG